ncbi:MAG: lipid A deacylase LpxR family protein [Opitutaceae bacterium]|nr:lipid A deacylase LpxR family protein [Opitutaceae bacterium]
MTPRSFSLFLRLGLFALMPATALVARHREPDATGRARSAPVFTVYFENDIATGTDEHYTNGLKVSWLSADLVEWGQSGWRQTFIEFLPFVNRRGGQKNIGLAFGQNIYTPRDITLAVPDPVDRPYAGWSYLELAFVSKTPAVSDTVAIQAGLIGPHSMADDTQRLVHQWSGISRPRGWGYQLHDEIGVNLSYERRWRLYARSLLKMVGIDLVPHAGASLGNVQMYANAGGTLRLGLNLPSDFGVQLARPGSVGGSPTDDLDPRVALDRNFSAFVFGACDGRAVARDIFLDGNTFRSSRSVTKEDFVADLSAGAGFIAGRWQLTYTQVWRTREFKSQREKYNNFGSITLSRAY